MKLNVKKSSAMNQIRKMTSLVAVYVIIKLQQRIILKLIFNINMKVSSVFAISVISNTLIRRVLEDMKVQSILVISVTIKLHIMVK